MLETQRPALVLGNLDGVHRGHQALISEARLPLGGSAPPVVVFTFNPHPVEVLAPKVAFRRIFSIEDQQRILKEYQISEVIYQKFDAQLASMDPLQFLEECLWKPLRPSRVVVGFNFRFGKNRSGGPEVLKQWGLKHGIEIKIVEALRVQGEIVSSSQIRQHLVHGEVMLAARLLGFPFFIRGRVQPGVQRGRTLGYPTANLECPTTLIPKDGIYVTRVKIKGQVYRGASHLGPLPSFSDPRPRLETFLLNFDGEIYNQEIQVEFLQWIREIRKFDAIDELKSQIERDIEFAKDVHRELDL